MGSKRATSPVGIVATDRLPAEGMSWDRAREFCHRLTLRLRANGVLGSDEVAEIPTEAQWEYACRAGTTSPWFFGNDASELPAYAYFQENSGNHVHPVGQKKSNPWGIFDLYGNVAEWCLDSIYAYQTLEEVNPMHLSSDDTLKIVRGGAFSDAADLCRSASRDFVRGDNRFGEDTGTRIIFACQCA